MNESDPETPAFRFQTGQDEKMRASLCTEEIRKALASYSCELVSRPFFTDDGRISTQTAVIPRSLIAPVRIMPNGKDGV